MRMTRLLPAFSLVAMLIMLGCSGYYSPYNDKDNEWEPYEDLNDYNTTALAGEALFCKYEKDTIYFFVRIYDQQGRMLKRLNRYNFDVLDTIQGQLSGDFNFETSEMGIPLSVGFCLDFSGSMTESLAHLKRACHDFIDNMTRWDRGAVIKFSGSYDIVQVFTGNLELLREAVDAIYYVQGGTAFYDATYNTLTLIEPELNKKAVIAFTDGLDNRSTYADFNKVVQMANFIETPIYTIGLGDEIDQDMLYRMAQETGGEYHYSPGPEDLREIYQELSATIHGGFAYAFEWYAPGAQIGDSITLDVYYRCAAGMLSTTIYHRLEQE